MKYCNLVMLQAIQTGVRISQGFVAQMIIYLHKLFFSSVCKKMTLKMETSSEAFSTAIKNTNKGSLVNFKKDFLKCCFNPLFKCLLLDFSAPIHVPFFSTSFLMMMSNYYFLRVTLDISHFANPLLYLLNNLLLSIATKLKADNSQTRSTMNKQQNLPVTQTPHHSFSAIKTDP